MTVEAPHVPSPSAAPRTGVQSHSLSADAFLSWGSMEGVYDPVVAAPTDADAALARRATLAPGYGWAAAVCVLAYGMHRLPFAPFGIAAENGLRHPISAAMIAIVLGLTLRNVFALPDAIKAGCRSAVKKIIPVAIVLMGAGLNVTHIASVGVRALLITLVCVAVAIAAGYYFGRLLGLNWKTALLLGTGTGICGNSAIVAVAPLIDADDDDLVLSIGAVNLFGLLAMLVWPIVGGMLHLSDEMFGVWSGTSIHAVPQVVAAGFAFSHDAGTLATLIKLVRVTLLAPLVFVLALLYARHHNAQASSGGKLTVRYTRLVPWFVWGFIALALLNTLGLLPTLHFHLADLFSPSAASRYVQVPLGPVMTTAGKVLLTLAMAAIGLEVNLRTLAGVGARAIQAGFLATITLGAASLAMIMILL